MTSLMLVKWWATKLLVQQLDQQKRVPQKEKNGDGAEIVQSISKLKM